MDRFPHWREWYPSRHHRMPQKVAIFSPLATSHNRMEVFSVPCHHVPDARYCPHGENDKANGCWHPRGGNIDMRIWYVVASHNRINKLIAIDIFLVINRQPIRFNWRLHTVFIKVEYQWLFKKTRSVPPFHPSPCKLRWGGQLMDSSSCKSHEQCCVNEWLLPEF